MITYLLLAGTQCLPFVRNQAGCLLGLDSLEVTTSMSVLEEDIVAADLLHSTIVVKFGCVQRCFLEAACK
jgi:hypothetical protein